MKGWPSQRITKGQGGMTKEQVGKLSGRIITQADNWRKIGQTVIMFGGLLITLWVEFLGPGIKSGVQEFLGITELAAQVNELQEVVPPPPVVEWNESMSRQQWTCTPERCVYTLNGARTRYGEGCGAPVSIIPFLRSPTGNSRQISFDDEKMDPVHLTRKFHSFDVWLEIPGYLSEGDYSWQAKIIYEHCPGRGEPIPRWTPWFPLRVTAQ